MTFQYIDYCFENASPVQWTIGDDGRVHIGLMYDYERGSPNRAAGHWHFRLIAAAGDRIDVALENFDNVWNGVRSSPISDRTNCFLSTDGVNWRSIPAPKTADNRLEFSVEMEADGVYLARLEPYRLSDLDRLVNSVRLNPLVAIETIGRTAEARPLEIIRIGDAGASFRVLIRARSHAWEPGGSWVVDGFVRGLTDGSDFAARFLDRCCAYVLPMADKDGVVRGRTRFTGYGADLNRGWEQRADPIGCPENAALESWLETLMSAGRAPQLVIDLHNDNSGKLHISNPTPASASHLRNMELLEMLLRRHTWFTEGSKLPPDGSPWTIGEGLTARCGIDACVLELNADWIGGLNKVPFACDWQEFGRGLRMVISEWSTGREQALG